MNVDTALITISSVFAIVGVGGIGGAFAMVKNMGRVEERRCQELQKIRETNDELKNSIESIKHTLGNGEGGIKEQIKNIQIACAGQMADVKARIENLEEDKRNGE